MHFWQISATENQEAAISSQSPNKLHKRGTVCHHLFKLQHHSSPSNKNSRHSYATQALLTTQRTQLIVSSIPATPLRLPCSIFTTVSL